MDDNERIASYLQRAKEAEANAAKTTDLEVKEGWFKIAAGYRELAERRKPQDWRDG